MLVNLGEREVDTGADMPALGRLILRYVDERRRLGQLTGQSPYTIRYRLWNLAEHVGPQVDIHKLTRRRIEDWLCVGDLSPATMRSRLSAVRAFGDWCVTNRLLRHNPAAGIVPARQPRLLPPRALEADAIAKVYRSCPDVRAETMVSLMIQLGLRAGGVASLQVGDVDLGQMMLTVVEKGSHERALPITTEAGSVLRRYLGEHRLTAGPLIRSYTHPRLGLSAHSVSRIVSGVMRDAGLDETGHALRHTFASDLLDRGVHVRTVQYVLGHSSISSTERYLRRFVGELREALEGRDYRR